MGCYIFEMTSNIMACFDSNQEMSGFGMRIVVGSGVFGPFLSFSKQAKQNKGKEGKLY